VESETLSANRTVFVFKMARLVMSRSAILCFALVLYFTVPDFVRSVRVLDPCCYADVQRDASFGPALPQDQPGLVGELYVAGYGCSATESKLYGKGSIWLVKRGGGCSFSSKVYNAQRAEAKAVIVYDDRAEPLIKMASDDALAAKIHIPSVFISKSAGERLIHEKASIVGLSKADSLPDIDIFNPPFYVIIWMFLMTFVFLVVVAFSVTIRRFCFDTYRPRYYNVNEPSDQNEGFDYDYLSDSEESESDKEDVENVDEVIDEHRDHLDDSDTDNNEGGVTVRFNTSGKEVLEPLLVRV